MIIEAKKGLSVFAIINHQANAKKVGLQMPKEKVILFGNPKIGTKIMLKDQRAGLDLPMKILVYQDYNGNTKIIYHHPKKWSKSYNLNNYKLIDKMAVALDKITKKASH